MTDTQRPVQESLFDMGQVLQGATALPTPAQAPA